MDKCNKCICIDCAKIGCYKYTVRYAYQRCQRCIVEKLPPWPECKYFQLPPDPEEIAMQEQETAKTQTEQLSQILEGIEALKNALLKND